MVRCACISLRRSNLQLRPGRPLSSSLAGAGWAACPRSSTLKEVPMQWENLTSLDFEKAVVTCDGVGLIPIGVLEPHGPHLPLGTDMFACHAVACRAAELEPTIVFHAYPYGINHESAHLPGSVVIRRDLVIALLENICDEMARHGLNKIILFSGHGGNRYLADSPILLRRHRGANSPGRDPRHRSAEGRRVRRRSPLPDQPGSHGQRGPAAGLPAQRSWRP